MAKQNSISQSRFENSLPTKVWFSAKDATRIVHRLLCGNEKRVPEQKVPVEYRTRDSFAANMDPAFTWLGWNTMLIQMSGMAILTDPVLSHRASPTGLWGPARLHDVPCGVSDLPDIDVVLISHDHYDHLDRTTIRALRRTGAAFVVPSGVGRILRRWGVSAERIHELRWWEDFTIGGITLTATPARHYSGRGLADRYASLWASWGISDSSHKVFFGGDTGYFDGFSEIAERLGPFDVTMLPIGAYSRYWKDVHLTPEQAVKVHKDLEGGVLIPIHYATFNLALHDWHEPLVRCLEAAKAQSVHVSCPPPGRTVGLDDTVWRSPWWNRPI
ncbi:MBL fold metallo-hydrolase [Desulfovibrio mangrovi]|uniref:MBL fold metallo-hydrolase n=1 Tax=Desulfovibrio mangrovi TaxID=2976983 RepID=UPI003B84ABC2